MHVTVLLKGGLGNQLFQLAFGLYLSEKIGRPLVLNGDWFLWKNAGTVREFELYEFPLIRGIPLVYSRYSNLASKVLGFSQFVRLGKILDGILDRHRINEQDWTEDSESILRRAHGTILVDGYWQRKDIVDQVEKTLRELLEFPFAHGEHPELRAFEGSGSVSIHVRRGDYVNNAVHGGICDEEYFRTAILQMRSLVKGAHFFVFSDDVAWAEEYMRDDDITVVGGRVAASVLLSLYAMSICRHHILSNSTFSWWAEWLGRSGGHVIAPKQWMKGLSTEASGLMGTEWRLL